jgi:hypothetical protein
MPSSGVSAINMEVIKNKEKSVLQYLKVHTILKLQSKKHEQFINFVIACSPFSVYCMVVLHVT